MPGFEKTVEFRRYFRLTKSSPEPLDPRTVEVRIGPSPAADGRASGLPAAALLWAHFQACRQGQLAGERRAPWERLDRADGDPEWIRFLQAVLAGGGVAGWIDDAAEVRRRAVEAYRSVASAAPRAGGRAGQASYRAIQRWVEREYGFTPSRAAIARCREACGLPVKRPAAPAATRQPCPESTRRQIEAAFRHFGLLPEAGV